MEKQPFQIECFEEAFLDYLRQRFDFEPLAHYVMAAMHICDETGRDYPPFVRDFMTWFADSFLFDLDKQGIFPAQDRRGDAKNHRWRRYQDCHDLLEGWRDGDPKGALEAQAERFELVEQVAQLRSEARDDHSGKAHRRRSKVTKTDAQVFEELEDWFGIEDYTLKRQHKKLTEPREYMSGVYPVALVHTGDRFEVKVIEIDGGGVFRLRRETEQPLQKF